MATKLKINPKEFDVKELDVEWSESDFEPYDGEQPPSGTLLNGYVKKLWWTYTADETPMIKVLWIADGNTGDREQYNGLPIWDNLVFKPTAAFKYGPFLLALGLTLKQVFANTYVSDDDDPNLGAPIEKIAKMVPGDDEDSARCGVVTKREKYKGEFSTKAGKFIEIFEQEDDEDDDEEEVEEPKTTRRKPAAATPKRHKPEPEPEDDEADDDDEAEEEDDDEEDEPPAKPSRRAPAKPAASKKTATRGRKPKDDDDDDPF